MRPEPLLSVGDVTLVAVLLAAGSLAAALMWCRQPPAEVCVITAEAAQLELKLPVDTTLEFRGPVGRTVVRVAGRTARIVESDCPDKLCVRQGAVIRSGQAAICVPNRVVVRLTGREAVDGITR